MLISKSVGSGHLLRIYKSLMAIFTRGLTYVLLTIILCMNRDTYHITMEWEKAHCYILSF